MFKLTAAMAAMLAPWAAAWNLAEACADFALPVHSMAVQWRHGAQNDALRGVDL